MTMPKYQSIADELRTQIVTGMLRPGDRLPTETQLMETYDVSRNTARAATAVLVNEGLIQRVPGRSGGMEVREQLTLTFHASEAEFIPGMWPESDAWFGEVQRQGQEPSQDFSVTIDALPAEYAERLGVDADSSAAVRRCVRKVNGRPSSLQNTWYPMSLCQQVPELLSPSDIKQGTTRLLTDRGFPQPALEDDLSAAMPTPDEARLLELQPGTPVLRMLRTGFSPDQVVRLSVTIFSGPINRVLYQLGDPEVIRRFRSN